MKTTKTITVREKVLRDALGHTERREREAIGDALYHGLIKESLRRMLEKGPDKTTPAALRRAIKPTPAKGKPKKLQPGKRFHVAPSGKTARILAILADGKDHAAVKIGKTLGMSSGAVAQHLAGRVKKGLVRRVLPGVFQMAWPKGKKAA